VLALYFVMGRYGFLISIPLSPVCLPLCCCHSSAFLLVVLECQDIPGMVSSTAGAFCLGVLSSLKIEKKVKESSLLE